MQSIQRHVPWTNHPGQVFTVSNVLQLSDDDAARLLEQRTIAPVWIELLQLPGQPVVLPQEQRVYRDQRDQLVRSSVARQEAHFGRRITSVLRVVERWQLVVETRMKQ